MEPQTQYSGSQVINLSPNSFLEAFFQSLLPYYENPEVLNEAITTLKIREAIELLLQRGSNTKNWLFDFSEPFKIDLESFMLQNYVYHVSLKEFARLSGRSISTFKRDFKKIFDTTPEKWIREQRLQKAHYLIKEKKQKPIDIYLQVGFENLSHFSTTFKEYFGFTPSSVLTNN
ncbi:helix-turn-helix domain-containing protein [Sphingobacterium sp. HJSM2_6]|uniref:helix-turn-helix domain-containing protein n=1 Tax=Sphingobacterium sp. HJSM2_6 TaxID=3366264 RepID=UPI003BE1761B